MNQFISESKHKIFKGFTSVSIPSKMPFILKILPEGFSGFFVSPQKKPNHLCTKCGIYIDNCPSEAISREFFKINTKKCINYLACTKYCPEEAREIKWRLKWITTKFLKPAIKIKRKNKWIFFNTLEDFI